jgi:hypothetical protein
MTLAFGLAVGLAGCGGGGDDGSTPVSTALSVPKACAGVTNVVGSSDALQGALINSLIPYLQTLPRSNSLVDISSSVATLLDVVDILSNAEKAGTAASALGTTTSTLTCSLAYLVQSVTDLAGAGISLTPAATAIVNDLLNTVYATAGLLNPTSGTPNFTAVTGNLTQIVADLGTLLNNLVASGSAATPVITLGNTLQSALGDVTKALNAALVADPSQLNAALTMVVQDLSSLVSSNTLSALGVKNDALSGLVNTLGTALNSTLTGLLHLLGLG